MIDRNKKPVALVLYDSDPNSQPRIRNIVSALRPSFELHVSAFCPLNDSSIAYTKLPKHTNKHSKSKPSSLVKKLNSATWLLKKRSTEIVPNLMHRFRANDRECRLRFEKLRSLEFNLVVCAHPWMLPLARRLGKHRNCKVVCDLYEFYPGQFDCDPVWTKRYAKYYSFLCKTYLPKADLCLVASKGFQDPYRNDFGIETTYFPCVTPYLDIEPKNVNPSQIQMVHHGVANESRELERMIMIANQLGSRYTLDLMIVPGGSLRYFKFLQDLADKSPNVQFRPPVPLEEIVPTIAFYDIGLYIMPPTTQNQRLATPNKIFEFVQGRLACAVGPSYGLSRIVKGHNVGIVSDDHTVESMVNALENLTAEQINEYKQNCSAAAKKLSLERWSKKLAGKLLSLTGY